jgi:copper(I)-binding protein
MIRLTAIVVALGLTGVMGQSQAAGAADDLTISGSYARAVPPGQTNSAAFMEITNASPETHALVGAESSVSTVAELHTHTMENGMMKMRRVDRIDLPAGNTVRLEPGGLHVMLIGLDRQLTPGEELDLTLIFEDHSQTRLTLPVRKVESGMSRDSKEHKCGGGRCGGN